MMECFSMVKIWHLRCILWWQGAFVNMYPMQWSLPLVWQHGSGGWLSAAGAAAGGAESVSAAGANATDVAF